MLAVVRFGRIVNAIQNYIRENALQLLVLSESELMLWECLALLLASTLTILFVEPIGRLALLLIFLSLNSARSSGGVEGLGPVVVKRPANHSLGVLYSLAADFLV